MAIYSWFTHRKWWFSIVFCMLTRPGKKKASANCAVLPAPCDFTTSALLLPLARFRVPHLSPRRAHDGTGRVHHTTHNLTSAMDGHWAQQKLAVSNLPWMAIWCHLSLWSSLIIQLFQEFDLFRHSAIWWSSILLGRKSPILHLYVCHCPSILSYYPLFQHGKISSRTKIQLKLSEQNLV